MKLGNGKKMAENQELPGEEVIIVSSPWVSWKPTLDTHTEPQKETCHLQSEILKSSFSFPYAAEVTAWKHATLNRNCATQNRRQAVQRPLRQNPTDWGRPALRPLPQEEEPGQQKSAAQKRLLRVQWLHSLQQGKSWQ